MNLAIYPVSSLSDNYIWMIVKEDENTALCVDPGEAAPVCAFLQKKNLTLRGILITHKHWDHTNGVVEIVNKFSVPVFSSPQDAVPGVTKKLNDGDEVALNGFPTFKVIAIPGHTLGHIAYHSDAIVFTGDTLFSSGCGKVFEGTPAQMLQSLDKLAALSESTKIYCGHEYTLANLNFARHVEPENEAIATRIEEVAALRKQQQPSLPSTLAIEKKTQVY